MSKSPKKYWTRWLKRTLDMKKFRIVIYLLLSILSILPDCSRKSREPVVAKVGDTVITPEEFHQRYEFTPQLLQSKDRERNKRNFLLSFLGEKIFAHEAYRRDYQQAEKFQVYSTQMENEAIVEKLFEDEVISQIEVTEDELKQAYFKSKQELRLQVLNFESEETASRAHEMIRSGKSMRDTKQLLQTQNFISADSVLTLSLRWGEAHPLIEDVAYALELNEISAPVEVQGINFIVKLIAKNDAIFMTEADYFNSIPELKRTIRSRKSESLYDDYLRSVMKDVKLNVSHEVFEFVASELERMYDIDDRKVPENAGPESYYLPGSLHDHLDDTFARFDDGTIWTIGDFVKKLSLGPYPLNDKSSKSFRSGLRGAIRRMAEFESLAQKGRDLGLQNSEYVQSQTRMWRDSYAASIMKASILDTVKISDEAIRYFYDKNPSKYHRPEMLKLDEIRVSNARLAGKLHRDIQAGANMSQLAKRYPDDVSTGVSGYFTKQALGVIGEIASGMKPGQLAEPVRTDDNDYSIFKLVDRLAEGPVPFEDVAEEVRSDALAQLRERTLDEYLMRFTEQTDIEINTAVYDTIQTYDINMLVIKKHFPNRLAAPLLEPTHQFHRWRNTMDNIIP